MRYFAIVVVILALVIGGGILSYNFLYPTSLEVAEDYLTALSEKSYGQLTSFYHGEEQFPSSATLVDNFKKFADAFGLTEIEIVDFEPIKESLLDAEYQAKIEYSSTYFDPITITINLRLERENYFDWKIVWADDLPLPTIGLNAEYEREIVFPERGSIYDRNGYLLAGEGSTITIGVQPGRISDPVRLFTTLNEMLGLSESYIRSQYQAPGVQDHWFVPLITVSESYYEEINQILRPIPGVFFRRNPSRVYPSGEAVAHITGYLGEVSAEMIAQYPEREYQVGERVGRSGLEYGEEAILRGHVGYHFFVRSSNSSEPVLFAETPVKHGEDIQLTLDIGMQELAVQVLGSRKASFVIIDAETGEILVLASTPSYDPNEFIIGISNIRWQELNSEPSRPMFNRALQGRYPPGSAFKALTAAIALETGTFSALSEFNDSGEIVVQGNIIRNFEGQSFGEHTLTDALVKSINTTMAKVGLELGAPTFREYFSRFQLDQRPELSLPANAGQIGNPNRSQVALAWSAIGQDQVLLTPYHMASLFSVFANNGMLKKPYLIEGRAEDADQVIQPETATEMKMMLEKVVLEGTGRQAAVENLVVAGKTGTAEVTNQPSHAWFAGYIENFGGKNLAFALIVEEGGIGGAVAAPIVREYFSSLLQLKHY
ncbi:MAG: hypothetical protein GX020_00165 [Firmicutes bacterium]|nr:hypothetical protein [Bacillota bacterium]